MGSTRVDAAANVRVDDSGNTRVVTQGALFSDATLELLDASVGAGHRDGSSLVVYVFRTAPMSLVSRTIEEQYFASTTFRSDAADTPANTAMLGRLTPPNVRVSVLKGTAIGRSTTTTRGSVKVANIQESHFDRNRVLTKGRGRYDALRKDYSWQGRIGDGFIGPEDGAFADDFEQFFACQIRDFDWSEDGILLVPGPALVDLDRPVQLNFYGQGYTVERTEQTLGPSADYVTGPRIIETISVTVFDDLSNVPMPLAYGRLFGVEAQEVSSINEIHQFHTGQEVDSGDVVQSLDEVYEDGLAFTPVTDYTYNLTNGTFTLDTTTSAIVTCDLHGAKAGPSDTYVDRPGEIIEAALTGPIGLAVADIATDTLAQYDQHFNYECGYYFGAKPVSMNKFLDQMLAPLGFAYRDRRGTFRVGRARNPADETADLVLANKDIKSVTRKATLRPVWRIKLGYQPVELPIGLRDFAGAVTESEIARQSNEYRWVEAIDEGVSSLHKSEEMQVETRFSQKADAQAVADEVLRLYGKQRDILEVKLNQKFMRYDVGDIVQLGWPRYDFVDDGDVLLETGDSLLLETGDAVLKEEDVAGQNFICVGYVDNPADNDFSLTLWG